MEVGFAIKRRMGLFYLFTSLFWGALYAYMSFMSPFSQSVGATAAVAGLIVGVYGLTQMLLRIPLGILSDRLRRRKPFLSLGALAAMIAALGMWLFPTPMGLLVFRGFAGVAAAAWVTITVLFSSYFDPADAPRALSRLNAFNLLGNMTASLVGAQIAQRSGEKNAFLLAIALGAVAVVISFFITENRPEQKAPISLKELLRVGLTPSLLVASGLAVISQMISLGTTGSFTQDLAKALGASTAQLGILTACVGLPNAAMSMFSSVYLTKRFTPRNLAIVGMGLITAAVLAAPLCQTLPALLAAAAVQGMGNGLTLPLLMSIAIMRIPAEKRGAAMGFFQSIYALGMFIGPVLTGFLSQTFALRPAFLAMGGISAVMLALALVFLDRRKIKPAT